MVLDGESCLLHRVVIGAQARLPPFALPDGPRCSELRNLFFLQVKRHDRSDLGQGAVRIPVIAVAQEDDIRTCLLHGFQIDRLRLHIDGDILDALLLHRVIEIRRRGKVRCRDGDAERHRRILQADDHDALRVLRKDRPAVFMGDDGTAIFFRKHLIGGILHLGESIGKLGVNRLRRIRPRHIGIKERRALGTAGRSLAAAAGQHRTQRNEQCEKARAQKPFTHRPSPLSMCCLPGAHGSRRGCSTAGRCADRAAARHRSRRHRRASPS